MTRTTSELGTLTERAEATRRQQAGIAPDPPGIPASEGSVSSSRVKARFVLVHQNGLDLPGIVLEWAKVQFIWTARVAYVIDDDATLLVQWIHADRLTPLTTTPVTPTSDS